MVKPLSTRWKRFFKLIKHYISLQPLRCSAETTPEVLHHGISADDDDDDDDVHSLTSGSPRPELDIEDYKNIRKALPLLFSLSGPFCKEFPPEE